MNNPEEEKTIWIIRFADNTLASYYGTRSKACEMAEEKKELYGGSFLII